MIKRLSDYFQEAHTLMEARRKIEVISPDEQHKNALYDLKKRLDDIDALTDFKYVKRIGKEQAKATFEVKDRVVFDRILEEVEKEHKTSLLLG